ncbi:LOW QUALITY PROTEIN: deoxyribonuclease-1-like [Lingula anatina]|uniref:Deoxyribonuclease n=1 Tax=Lingula anatina TaxID=7574 RepID=A0A1S3K985_LINAN|nr:LOW QUALITY PROTEIN: deoxyribonuclease-1-like [Lingula anatina]|eukprot:XP_013419185.2 LOW QUALITY PROTEIN: deoxyribonuclease-1-like [Lingula anatina]
MGRILPFALVGFLYLGLLVGSAPTKQRLVRSSGGTTGLKIAAFNVQIFGKTKMSKEEVVDILVQIVQRYDIILIQEIRDVSQESIYELLSLVNQQGGHSYSMELSERLGRSRVKEQYAFLYRDESATVLESYQYDDGPDDGSDAFEREPFFVKFRSLISGVEFVLCTLHAKPTDAVNELNALADVVSIDVANKWPTDDVLVLGDLNADCNYVRDLTCSALSLRCSPFTWLIPDDADTTVSTTDCAYDRFVARGQDLVDGISNVSVFRFDLEYGLTNEEAKAVSDHYPIELELV